jgi:hypothetical protein
MESDEGDDDGEEDGEESSTSIAPNKKPRPSRPPQGLPAVPKFVQERGGNDEEEKVAEVGREGGGEFVKVGCKVRARWMCEISEMGRPLRP